MSYNPPKDWSETEIIVSEHNPVRDWSETEVVLSSKSAAYELSGTVTDTSNNSIDGATITWEFNGGTQIAKTTTDSSGNYSFESTIANSQLPNETTVTAEADTYTSQTKPLTVSTGTTTYTVDYSLSLSKSTYSVSGVVESLTGEPVPFSIITWKRADGSVIDEATPDLSGNYSVQGDIVDSELPETTTLVADPEYYLEQPKNLNVDTSSTSYSKNFRVKVPRSRHQMIK